MNNKDFEKELDYINNAMLDLHTSTAHNDLTTGYVDLLVGSILLLARVTQEKSQNVTNNKEIIDAIRSALHHQLEAKTGWGRNEIKHIFEAAIQSVI